MRIEVILVQPEQDFVKVELAEGQAYDYQDIR
jgi:hypothetical protein